MPSENRYAWGRHAFGFFGVRPGLLDAEVVDREGEVQRRGHAHGAEVGGPRPSGLILRVRCGFVHRMVVPVACAVGVAIGLLLLWAGSRAAITIAVAEIHDGHLELTRGSLPPRVLDDLRDIAVRPRIKSATVRIVRARDRARVEVHGEVSEPQRQRLRNVVGNVRVAQLVRAKNRR
jgi:Protein of unknown function (DUF3634)